MPDRRRSDPKLDALRQHGALNPHPDRVIDVAFRQSEFFDARDAIQVKYEMVRKVQLEGASVVAATEAFGFSRPSFYDAQAALARQGLAGLLPRKRGPRGSHKLTAEILAFISEIRAGDPSASVPALVSVVKTRFGIDLHPRTIERALAREKKRR